MGIKTRINKITFGGKFMKKRLIYKWLRKASSELPFETYVAIGNVEREIEFNGEMVKYIDKENVFYPKNHYRRLKRIWNKKHDESLIHKYFNEREMELKEKGAI